MPADFYLVYSLESQFRALEVKFPEVRFPEVRFTGLGEVAEWSKATVC